MVEEIFIVDPDHAAAGVDLDQRAIALEDQPAVFGGIRVSDQIAPEILVSGEIDVVRLQVGPGPYGVDVGRPAVQHGLGIQIDEFDIGALVITVIAAEQQIAGIGARACRVGEAEPRLSGNAGGLLDDQIVSHSSDGGSRRGSSHH